MKEFYIESEYIQLDNLLKACRLVNSGGEAHFLVENGDVTVNGEIESRKRAKLRNGDTVKVFGETIKIVSR
ncbi:MAG: RNA-binding S4 domain-containing protein [Bacteroidales bacterium]